MSENLPAVVQHGAELSVDVVINRMQKVEELLRKAMRPGIDFGVIPGTERKDKDGHDVSKPTLLKPGAEKLCVLFNLCPEYKTAKHFDGLHLTVESTCRIVHRDGTFLGEANAIASTNESKYRYRGGSRLCPECGKATIKKSKFPPRNRPDDPPGFYCYGKIGGCGKNFDHDDQAITAQSEERQENPDIADSYNTVLRIAEKRAYIAAVRLVTGSSALFDEEHGLAEQEPPEERTSIQQEADELQRRAEKVSPRVAKEREVQDMLSAQGKTLASMLKWLNVDQTTQLSGLTEQQLQSAYLRLKEKKAGAA